MQIGQNFKNSQKVKENICGQTTSENGQNLTIRRKKSQFPTLLTTSGRSCASATHCACD